MAAQPYTALSGVRSSCDSVARNSGRLLPCEELEPLPIDAFADADVPRDLRGPDDRAAGISDRRDGE
jgi:hypothetical protein